MRIFHHALRATLLALTGPLLLALLLCAGCLLALPPHQGLGPDRTAGYWLHLPGLLLLAAGLAAVLEAWPPLSRERPGASWLLRVRSRAPHGAVAACLGALCALAIAFATVGLCFFALAKGLGFDQGEIHAEVRCTSTQPTHLLHPGQPRLAFQTAGDAAVQRVRAWPTGLMPPDGDFAPARLRLLADGAPLHEGWLANRGEPIDLPVDPPRPIRTLSVERDAGGGFVLRLRPDQLSLVSDRTRPGWANCLLAILSYVGPAALAAAVLVLGQAQLALPVNLAAGFAAALLATLLGLTPNAAAVAAFARGRWIGTEDLSGPWLLTGAAAGALVALRFLVGRAGR